MLQKSRRRTAEYNSPGQNEQRSGRRVRERARCGWSGRMDGWMEIRKERQDMGQLKRELQG